MQGFNPSEIVSSLLKYLTSKEEEVLRRRFGLDGKDKDTLESIGKLYQVTRERIRQIESTAIKKIKGLSEFKKMESQLEYTIANVIKKNGNIMEEEALLNELLSFSSNNPLNHNCTIFILEELLSKKFIRVSPSASLKKSWSILHVDLDFVKETINKIVEVIKEDNKPIPTGKLLEKFNLNHFYQENKDRLTDEAIISYITISARIDKNPFEEYGLSEWGSINPKRMRDKIYLILKKERKPLHFIKITELINKVKFDHRKAYAPTVHNELILNKDFVLVGRGIYALQEWGYKPGVVADVLVEILKKAGNPLTREELVNKVLEQRVVRKNTIHLALTDKSKFKKLEDKRYTLVDNHVA
ncbi:MAG: hypothetical protein COY66_06355 [Candidatus Kerfeldbacteria bacterium CG_4_10_14_0_8_um_filter_42_10]|uniref:HTH HARE-type domain-containing protein n=1 Tax=Candidatus Kerfeldbacteria bacterium CG_4_10_14_0_8_um_filter_42_10 TaxID=2014248 RepID=A0A2M7RFS2_9BACT|nr:MAG: hypothetical protein COY66_06355 [Candidatus Kerfeldbacteria bacterium CG_4_10_14_0_8_um_filter_42_10]